MKYVLWNTVSNNRNIAFTEMLERYARGDTFWQALEQLMKDLPELPASANSHETPLPERLKMYQETGMNKVEILVEADDDRFAVACANSRSFIQASSEQEALRQYIATRARTTVVNTGEVQSGS